MAINYKNDIVNFTRKFVPMEGAPAPIIPDFLEYWLYKAFPLPHGNPVARDILDSRSKKQGKSTLAAAVGLYMATRKDYAEIPIISADKDQSQDRILRAIKYAVEQGPLGNHAKTFKDAVEFSNKSVIKAFPQDWRGAAGGNYYAVLADELHTYTLEAQRRLYDEMVIPPTQPDGVRWIASYAGFEGESTLLREIWDHAQDGKLETNQYNLPIYYNPAASLLALIDQGERSWRMPWTTREYINTIREKERPNTFARLWLNMWVSALGQFVSKEQWEACYSDKVQALQPHPNEKRRMVLGADASSHRDYTALVGSVLEGTYTDAVLCKVWKPRGKGKNKTTIDLSATIEKEILQLHEAGNVRCVYYDPYQLHSIATNLKKKGVQMIEFPQTSQRTEADQGLFDAIVGKTIRHYGHPELTEAVLNAVAIDSPRGLRLAKEKTDKKIDAAVALSMSRYGAIEQGRYTPLPENKIKQPSKWMGRETPTERIPIGWARKF